MSASDSKRNTPTIAIITPTLGRETLRRTADNVMSQLGRGDQWILVSDGDLPFVRSLVASLADKRVTHFRHDSNGSMYGNAQRNAAIEKVCTDCVLFVDDDDELLPCALDAVRQNRGDQRPLMFRMDYRPGNRVLWSDKELRPRNVAGPMFCVPNKPDRIGRWPESSDSKASDLDFILDTLAKWPADSLEWRPEVICRCDRHGLGRLEEPLTANLDTGKGTGMNTQGDVTIFVPLSGRVDAWPRFSRWLDEQTSSHNQTRLILFDTSQDRGFSQTVRQWVSRCDYVDVRHIQEAVGRPGLADEERRGRRDVQDAVREAVAKIYNRMAEIVDGDFVLTVEDDITPPNDVVSLLLERFDGKTVSVAAPYRSPYHKGYVAWSEGHQIIRDRGHGVKIVEGNGFGCTMLRRSVLDSTVFTANQPPHHDFDPAFYADMKRLNATCRLVWAAECEHRGMVETRSVKRDKNTVDIVVVRYRNKAIEDECLKHIQEQTDWPYRIVEVDNSEHNRPLSTVWNEALANSDCDYVCLLNSDAFVTRGWLKKMMARMDDPKVAAVGPSGDHVGGIQRTLDTPSKAAAHEGQTQEVTQLSGFCMLLRKDVPFGFTDEVPFYGGEHCWCVEATRAGYKLLWAQDAFVEHLGEHTAKKEGTCDSLRQDGQERTAQWLAATSPVLFTTFNRLEYTKQSLPALIESKTGSILIYDNASTDGTREYLRQVAEDHPERLRIHFADENTGIAGAMNWFFDQTRGEEFCGKVDNDTVVPPGWFLTMIKMCLLEKIDAMQAKHHVLHSRFETFNDWMNTLRRSKRNAHIYLAPHVGGSGLVVARHAITDPLPDTPWLLQGWGQYQHDHPGLKKAFCDNVYVKLLDMTGDNEPRYSDYPAYYDATGRTAIRSRNAKMTLADVFNRLGRRFAYTRFGDGELQMLTGWEGRDITQFNSAGFQAELTQAFKIDDPDYLIGCSAGMVREQLAEPGLFAPFDNDDKLRTIVKQFWRDKTFYSPIAFHYYYTFLRETFDLFVAMMRNRKVALVGGQHLVPLKRLLEISDVIVTPETQSYDTIDEWFPGLETVARRNEVVLLAIGPTAKVAIGRLWSQNINCGLIDLGSVASALVDKTDTHTWIQKSQRINTPAA